MPDQETWLRARAAGRDLLLATQDLREVIPPPLVFPMPGCPRGLEGLVIHQGEFLPVLAWGELPGCSAPAAPPVALAVLRLRLGMPLERLQGTLVLGPETWRETPEGDPWRAWISVVGRIDGVDLPRVHLERLIEVLHGFREPH